MVLARERGRIVVGERWQREVAQGEAQKLAVDVAEGGGRRFDNGHAGVGAHVEDVVEQRVGLLHQH